MDWVRAGDDGRGRHRRPPTGGSALGSGWSGGRGPAGGQRWKRVDEDIARQQPANADVTGAAQQLLANALDHYKVALRASGRAGAYLRGRGISADTAAKFGVGYARASWQDLGPVLAGQPEAVVEATGLVVRREDGGGFDRFRDRIMFPIRDAMGFVVGFGARVLDGAVTDAKYLNSPEGPVFRKRESLFGLWEARQAIKSSGQVVVMEGYVDVISSAQAGVENVVATLGTACTVEQLQLLLSMAREVVFCFDGDAAGRKAAERALLAVLPLVSADVSIRFAFLPSGHDPDSLVQEGGAQGLRDVIAAAGSLENYLLAYLAEGCNLEHLEGRVKAAARAGALWRTLSDGALAEALLTHCVDKYGISATSLLASWQRGGRN